MNKHPLLASKEKIKAAERKVVHLTDDLNAFLQSNPCRVIVRKERLVIMKQGELRHHIAQFAEPVPSQLAIDVASVTVQLRDALDKMTVALVVRNQKGPSGVGFPFGGKDRKTGKIEPYPTARHDRIKDKVGPEAWDLIIRQKPYPGGNDLLWSVNQVANADKHWEDLLAVRARSDLSKLTITPTFPYSRKGTTIFSKTGQHSILEDKQRETLLFTQHPDSEVHIETEIATSIVFGEIEPITGKEVLGTLHQQIRLVGSVVKLFADTFY